MDDPTKRQVNFFQKLIAVVYLLIAGMLLLNIAGAWPLFAGYKAQAFAAWALIGLLTLKTLPAQEP
ncbi:MAG: hypothetical protein EP341_06675 [Sphingomonadales bacterium]|nr:MAG: hypothetical protein EP341_06675 [Sphingomonadales bacterium]